jgi:hypothetical protein
MSGAMTRCPPATPLAVLRLALAALAVVGQLLIGSVVPAVAAGPDAATLFGIPEAICHAHDTSGTPGDNAPGHHGIDCALCPLCFALAPIAALPDAPAPLPGPAVALAARATPPIATSTAPRARGARIPPPRGPPVLA